jgi:putative FmdB family regulatory protein
MPKYTYKCSDCDAKLTFYHTMSENRKDCSACDASGSLRKLPSNFSIEKQEAHPEATKPGDTVKKSIEQFKQDLDSEKKSLKGVEWYPNE